MKVAIIGFGNIAIKHKQAIEHAGDVIIASVNRSEKGNQLAKEHSITNTYTSVESMLQNESPDAIVVTVSYENIYKLTKLLIPYKIPLLIEKPAGTSLSELNELIQMSEENGTIVQVAMNRRHYEIIQTALAHMGGKDMLTAIDVEWSETPLKLLLQKGYSREQVAKIIYGNSIHGIDMATYFGGELENVHIQVSNFGDDFRWYMQFSGKSSHGVLVSFRSSWDHPVPWKMIMSTRSKRYVFAPLEKCNVQETDISEMFELNCDEQTIPIKAGFMGQWETFKQTILNPQLPLVHDLKSCLSSMSIAEDFYIKLTNAQK